MANNIKFSIIIPTYNSSKYIKKCIDSLLSQNFPQNNFEIIIVDDYSSDDTLYIANSFKYLYNNIKIISSIKNCGPGIARNIGVDNSLGEWILFLDSDDSLCYNALNEIYDYINKNNELDTISFNWAYSNTPTKSERKDFEYLKSGKEELFKEYLCLHTDSSIIYTAVRKQILIDNDIKFYNGYHEDVDYFFKIYWYSKQLHLIDKILYLKYNRSDSIINTISNKHIIGFIEAWKKIKDFLINKDKFDLYAKYYVIGLYGIIATRLREINRNIESKESKIELYNVIYDYYYKYFSSVEIGFDSNIQRTKYILITSYFLTTMNDTNISNEDRYEKINNYLKDILPKSWSCIDLHSSVFLSPTQIRTCCKRFFINKKMKGDVCLIDISESIDNNITYENILKTKQQLFLNINKGERSDCDGCPFIEFKNWRPLDKLEINFLSLEYHTICNLKCSYCSDLFYSGENPKYNVIELINSLLKNNSLDNCNNIVWGGGEPTLHTNFDNSIKLLTEALPNACQKILTNSVKYSLTIENLLKENKISITTSIDAGTEETYSLVRGHPFLKKVLKNLKKYATINSKKVTIKYIFTEQNYSNNEIDAFIDLMKQYNLIKCNYQISSDFTHEQLSIDEIVSIIRLYNLLITENCRLVYIDDLLRIRLKDTLINSENIIKSKISQIGFCEAFADKSKFTSVIIWGAGQQAKHLLEETSFFKNVKLEFFVDSTPSKIGNKYLGYEVLDPSILLKSDIPVIIAAVQGYSIIYEKFLNLGIEEIRLIKSIII